MLDASRSVGVVASLIGKDEDYVQEIMEEYTELREEYYAGLEDRKFVDLAKAQDKKYEIVFEAMPVPPIPNECGVHVIDNYTLDMVLPYIDWNPFFQTWELRGKYPAIFDDPVLGEQARELFDDARELLDQIVSEGLLTARGVYGFWPAVADGQDIVLFSGLESDEELVRFPMLRQQWQRRQLAPLRQPRRPVAWKRQCAPQDCGCPTDPMLGTWGSGKDEAARKCFGRQMCKDSFCINTMQFSYGLIQIFCIFFTQSFETRDANVRNWFGHSICFRSAPI